MLCIAQTSTECSEVGANTPLLRSRRQTPLWCLSACTGEVYFVYSIKKVLYPKDIGQKQRCIASCGMW